MIDIELILEDLKIDKEPKTQRTLDILNNILKEYQKETHKDFSITNIGRVSSKNGGPGYASLRATKNGHYRRLIESWASLSGTTTKKPLSKTSRKHRVPEDHKLLERIPDIAVRALFGQIIAERNRLKNDVSILKQHANIVIDKRPMNQVKNVQKDLATDELEVSFLSSSLKPLEIQALKYAISDECMENMHWVSTSFGQVKDVDDNEIFPRGFTTGIAKTLGIIDE